MTVLSVIGIALMAVSGVLFWRGHKERAKQVRTAARVVSTTNRAIRTVRVVMAFTSGASGLGLTGYDIATPNCDDDESLRRPPAIVQLVSNTTPLAQGEGDGEETEGDEDGEDNNDERCDD